MRLPIVAALTSLALLCVLGDTQAGGKKKDKKHKLLHSALWELHHAQKELTESSEDYGGHKAKALTAMDGAIKSIEGILKQQGDDIAPKPTKKDLREVHKQYAHHPFLHHALHELKAAHKHVSESSNKFGGQRETALKDMHHAIHHIELVLKHAKQAETK